MIALLALAAAAPLVSVEDTAQPTVITNVAIVDREGHTGPRQDVLLAEGLIVALEDVGRGWSDPNMRVIDGTGKTLLPGLIDTHVHVQSTFAVPGRVRIPNRKQNLQSMLFAGVTTALDLSMERDALDATQAKIDAGRWAGPQLYGTGKPFTAPDGHPLSSIRGVFGGPLVRMATARSAWTVETRDDVDDAVSRQGQTGFKKIMFDAIPHDAPTISDEAADRVRIAATALGDRLIAHVGTPQDLDRALALPVDALAHAPSHGTVTQEQARELAVAGIEVTPTLAVWQSVVNVHTGTVPRLPFEDSLLTRRQQRDLSRARDGRAPMPGDMGAWADSVAIAGQERGANVRTLRDGSVTLLVGSDSPNLGIPAGAGLHMEMTALLDAGMERADVLRAVTWVNSRFLDPDARFGAIQPGWQADLLLVEGDPEVDLTALQRIVSVWTDGRQVTRHAP